MIMDIKLSALQLISLIRIRRLKIVLTDLPLSWIFSISIMLTKCDLHLLILQQKDLGEAQRAYAG